MNNNEITAKFFLNEIKKANLTGQEFIALIGNSKLDNSAFTEIRDSGNLTGERLLEIFEQSELTSSDYLKMMAAAFTIRQKKEEQHRVANELKLKAEIERANKRIDEAKEIEKIAVAARPDNERTAGFTPISKNEMSYSPSIEDINDIDDIDSIGDIDDETHEIEVTVDSEVADKNSNDYDDEYDNDDFGEYDDEKKEKTNKAKIIVSFCLAFVLVLSSFALRYINTGSFFLAKTGNVETEAIETYQELAERIHKLEDPLADDNGVAGFSADFYLKAAHDSEIRPEKVILNTEKYAFYYYDGILRVVDITEVSTEFAAEISKPDAVFNSMLLHDDKLFVIYDYEYTRNYATDFQLDAEISKDENGEPIPNRISGGYKQQAVLVDIYETADFTSVPILTYTLDGNFKDIGVFGDVMYVSTDFVPFNTAYADDANAFIPSFSLNGQSELIPIENIRLINAQKRKSFTVTGFIGDLKPIAAVGAIDSGTTAFDSGLYMIMHTETATEIIRYGKTTDTVSFSAPGMVYVEAVDETNGIVRFCSVENVSEGKKAKLYVLDTTLTLLSETENIAQTEVIKDILFDEQNSYIMADKIYIVNTSIPEEPIIADKLTVSIYEDDYLYWTENGRIALSYEEKDGKRSGLNVMAYKLEKGEYTEMASELITAQSTVSGNWNEFLVSSLDNERFKICMAPQMGVIILPVSYFNGISKIDKFMILEYGELTGISEFYSYVEYDLNAETLASVITEDEQVYLFINDEIRTFNLSSVS